MPDLWLDVDIALSEVPVNIMPLIDDTDFKSIEASVAYNAAGMALKWNFVTTDGAMTQTAVTPTTAGVYDWTNQGNGMYSLEIPASGGGSINNDTEGFGWFTGFATGVLPWRGPTVGFRAAGLNDKLIDSAYSTTLGLAGTALPAVAAEGAGGLFTRGTGAGQINQPANGMIDSNVVRWLGTAASTPTVAGVPNVNVKTWNDLTTVALPLVPTTAGRTLDVSTTGEAGIDWANVGSPTTTVGLTGTTISTSQVVASVTGAVGSVTGAVGSVTGNVGGNVVGSVASVTARVTANTDQWNGVAVGSIPPDAIFIRSGTAQAGGASTITLDASASATNNLYQNETIFIRSGTGAGQSNIIASYVGATKVATVAVAWATTPDNTSVFSIISDGPSIASVSGTVSANVTQWLGTAVSTPTVAGVPNVNTKTWNDLATVALPLIPTTAGRTLDVSTTGEAGLDWANIGSPTTAQNLSATNIDVDQIVASVSGAVGSVTGAVGSVTGNVGGNVVGSVASVVAVVSANLTQIGGVAQSATDLKDFADDGYDPATNKVQGVVLVDTVTTYTGNTPQTGDSFSRIGVAGAGLTNIDLPNQAMDITGNITGNLSGSVGSVTGAVGSVTGNVGGTVASVVGAVGSVTGNVGGNVVGSVGSVVGAVGSVAGAVGSVTGNVGGNIAGSVGSVTGNVGGNVVGSVDSVTDPVTVGTNNDKTDYLLAAGQLQVIRNAVYNNFSFLMVDVTGNPATGLTVAAARSIDGGSYAACANAVAEVANGTYKINLAAADLNGKDVILLFTATGAKNSYIKITTQL